MTSRWPGRRALLAATAVLAAAGWLPAWLRASRNPATRLGIPRRSTPGTEARRLDVGTEGILVREDLFESGIYSDLRRRSDP